MINRNIKRKAKEIINLKLTDHFKYNEDSEFFDDMAIYEEAFDYAYWLVRNHKELFSNFVTYKNHAKEVLKYLKERFDHVESGYIYEKLYEFFNLINNEKNIKVI